MGWLPDDHADSFWFAVSPVTSFPIAVYSAAAYVTGDWRFGRPDAKESVRNAGIWGAIAVGVHAWNSYYHPGKYSFTSASSAVKTAAHLAAVPSVILPVVATGAAIGWAATAEHHGAVTPGVASGIGMPMSEELYSGGTAGNPAGWDFGQWWDDLF